MNDTRNPTLDPSLVGTITANLFHLIRLDQCDNHLYPFLFEWEKYLKRFKLTCSVLNFEIFRLHQNKKQLLYLHLAFATTSKTT